MAPHHVRVRFAPAPTGFMHLGNVRAALINYLFARQKDGTFIVRIEDTDAQRNIDPGAKHILEDLAWLQLSYDEGPHIGGPHAPYFQSERTEIYTTYLEKFTKKQLVYRCFCTTEELEKKRQRQIALKQPPRYDRTCANLTQEQVQKNLDAGMAFIWRFKLPDIEMSVTDLARGQISYHLKNFSDFPLTRQDGSFTFVFANFVDDVTMQVTHVFRGEEHISSTALQGALYRALDKPIPIFWHFPVICNALGKKLSKRDFGFSLSDLRNEGYFPEAIVNYLAIIGGSYAHEIMPLAELVTAVNFEQDASAGYIRYDVEKLRWVNHQWVLTLPVETIAERCAPFLQKQYPEAAKLSAVELAKIIQLIKDEIIIAADVVPALQFLFERPTINASLLEEHEIGTYRTLLQQFVDELTPNDSPEEVVQDLKLLCKERNAPIKTVFSLVRIALTGKAQGLGVKELASILPRNELLARLQLVIG